MGSFSLGHEIREQRCEEVVRHGVEVIMDERALFGALRHERRGRRGSITVVAVGA